MCCVSDGLGGHVFEILDFGMEFFLFVLSEDFFDLSELLRERDGSGFVVSFGSEIDGFGIHLGK